MKSFTVSYRLPSGCRSCPEDLFEFLVQDYEDRLLVFENGKPVIYYSWEDVLDLLPTKEVTIKEEEI